MAIVPRQLTLRIVNDAETTKAMTRSFGSILNHLAASRGAVQLFADFFPGVFDCGGSDCVEVSDQGLDIFICHAFDFATDIAGEIATVRAVPRDQYLKAVAAVVARSGEMEVVFSHGWPILSVAGDTATVAEAGEASRNLGLPGGGVA